MKKLLVICPISLALALSTAPGAALTPGNVVVVQCAGTSSAGNTGSLLEYSPGGTLVQTIPLTNASGNPSIYFGNTVALPHDITLSADGALVVIPGYAQAATSIEATTAAVDNRVIATVKWDGSVALPILNSALVSGQSPRGATSDGFGNFWVTFTSGMRYVTPSAPTVSTTVNGTGSRACGIYNGQLYATVAAGASSVSPNFPTGSASYIGYITTATSGDGFAIPPGPTTGSKAYVANYNDANGLYAFNWNGSGWDAPYALKFTGVSGNVQHLAVDYSGATPVIYFTTTSGANNGFFKYADTGGVGGTFTATTFATATGGAIFRGVAMAPTRPALPSFTTSPANTTNSYGATATFGPVAATGANPNAWTWQKAGVPLANGVSGTGSTISGATSDTLTIANINAGDAGNYYAVASNNGGSTTSSPAILALAGSSITTQLKSITNVAGTTATFTVVSGGPAPLTYAWQFGTTPLSDGPSPSGSGATISGSSTNTLAITGVQDADSGTYTVTVSDSSPADSSSAATLTVVDPPQITVQPANQNKVQGATANFTVTATGGALSYQWRKGVVVLTNGPSGTGSTNSGATSSHLVIANVQPGDAGSFTVIVTNLAGSATSSPPATLTVGQIPTVAFGNQTNWPGSNVVFSAVATGTAPLIYVWKHDGGALNNDGHYNGVDTDTLSITPISTDDARRYTLTVSNSYGSTSVDGYLFVRIAAPEISGIPGLILYDKFNYPVQPYSGFPAPAGWVNNWEYIISAYNQVSGRAAYWVREGNAYSTIESGFLRDPAQSTSGQYPWPGIDCSSQNQWYWSSAPNNNHLKFGGVDQTNGAAYFSLILHITQGGALNTGQADTIAGFTSGDSANGGANVDTYAYTLATLADGGGGDGYYLGVFKGGSAPVTLGAVNGEWAYSKHLFRGGIHLIVGCYKFVSGGTTTNDDIVSLWIDPPTSSFGAVETNLPPPDAGGAHTNWSANAAITEFALRGTVPPASKRMTDLRIGKTWASVTGPYYPRLSIVSTPPDVTVTWPTKDSGYVLQESPGLSPASWVTNSLPPPYALDGTGTNNTVTVPGGSATDFLRLVYPPR